MAVTILVADVAVAAQLDEATATRLLAVATSLVERFAPDAPEGIQNEAAIRVCGWLDHSALGSIAQVTTGPRTTEYAVGQHGALRHSGAMSLLSPWKVRRGGAV